MSANLFDHPIGPGNAGQKSICVAFGERGQIVEEHQIFGISARDDMRH
jgi:hypothetical protein